MSCYFNIYLNRREENPNSPFKINLFELGTSEARALANEVNLKYTEYTDVDKDLLQAVYNYFREECHRDEKLIKNGTEQNKLFKERCLRCSGDDLMETLSLITENDAIIEEAQKELDYYEIMAAQLDHIRCIYFESWDEIQENYTLEYYLG